MRPVGIAGAMFFSIPNVALAFVNNVYEMAFIFFLQGIGIGLLITICNTNFNAYFVKKRTRVSENETFETSILTIYFRYSFLRERKREGEFYSKRLHRNNFMSQVMSLAQTITGMGGIAYPICIEKMMSMYGFRGNLFNVNTYEENILLHIYYIFTDLLRTNKTLLDIYREKSFLYKQVKDY